MNGHLVAEQRPWHDGICAANVTTAAGVLAIVGSFVVFVGTEPDMDDNRDDCFDERLVSVLRRPMVGKVGVGE